MTCVQIGVFDWLSRQQKGSIFVKMYKNLLLINHMEDEAKTWHTCLGYYPLQKLCFYFGRIRTLVAMAILSLHRLIMGKVEISAKWLGIFVFFLQKCLFSSPPCFIRLLSKSLDLIG